MSQPKSVSRQRMVLCGHADVHGGPVRRAERRSIHKHTLRKLARRDLYDDLNDAVHWWRDDPRFMRLTVK